LNVIHDVPLNSSIHPPTCTHGCVTCLHPHTHTHIHVCTHLHAQRCTIIFIQSIHEKDTVVCCVLWEHPV
jgi:biotin synthase-related radical SAM superfamily protein